MSGPTLKDAVEIVDAETGDDRPAFYGINCSHPLEFMPAIEPGSWFERVLEVGDAAQLGERMGGLARQYPHIDIWGGCCGTWETHLDEIARNVAVASAEL